MELKIKITERAYRMNKIEIDFINKVIISADNKAISLHTTEGFDIVKKLWEYTNWANKYSYNFTWLGRPIIQLPDDVMRIQELIYKVKPDVIIETGVAHGGSLILYASLLKLMNKGKIIGVDIEIRPHNRKAIEDHELFPLITLIEGSSTEASVLDQIRGLLDKDQVIMVILDSCHTKDHVLKELLAYSDFVSKDSYILVADGIMQDLAYAPGAQEDWTWNNPVEAVNDFLKDNKNFIAEEIKPVFSESNINSFPTYYPTGILKKIN